VRFRAPLQRRIRRKVKVKEDLEFYSVMRVRAIEHADICILIIDDTLGLKVRIKVFWLAEKNREGLYFGEQMGFS
jgi:GTP-binding protein